MKAIFEQRLAKLKEMRERGIDPYPRKFEQTHLSGRIKADYEDLSANETRVSVAGRLVSKRPHGKTAFGHLRDVEGDIQAYFRRDDLGEERFALLDLVDIGDFVGVSGTVFKTRTEEITVKVSDFEVLSKSLRPLPEKWHGLKDKETRYRRRYVDLFANLQVREVFLKRTAVIGAMRKTLDEKGFIEVETPVLQPIYGGGSAEPFVTHHQALDQKLYLRIADELYLKRLLVGGLEKVYEISKDFRNEGMDRTHSPEFTQLELYQAYADYYDMMDIFEEIMERVAIRVNGSTRLTYQKRDLDLKRPWERITVLEAMKRYADIDLNKVEDTRLREICAGITDADWGHMPRGAMIEEVLGHYVEPKLISPTILYDYPLEVSPLAKVSRRDDRFAERFEPFVVGVEIGNAFSELNDPVQQRRRLEQQLDDEGRREEIDLDFVRALEYGMPPAGGLGIGVDRVVMLMTDSHSIRDVVLFPPMRPETDLDEDLDGI
jgi:lysyl-tRNA synthetase class 2